MSSEHEMAFKKKANSSALVKTEVVVEGKGTLVVAAGYTTNQKFGYFITYEDSTTEPGWFVYNNTICFIERTSETSYKEALDIVKKIVEQHI